MIPIVSLFIGCGTSVNEGELDMDSINTLQEGLAVAVGETDVADLPQDATSITLVGESLDSVMIDKRR